MRLYDRSPEFDAQSRGNDNTHTRARSDPYRVALMMMVINTLLRELCASPLPSSRARERETSRNSPRLRARAHVRALSNQVHRPVSVRARRCGINYVNGYHTHDLFFVFLLVFNRHSGGPPTTTQTPEPIYYSKHQKRHTHLVRIVNCGGRISCRA